MKQKTIAMTSSDTRDSHQYDNFSPTSKTFMNRDNFTFQHDHL